MLGTCLLLMQKSMSGMVPPSVGTSLAISLVAEAPRSVAEWAVVLRFDNPLATALVLLLGDNPL